jgi:membrane fusion protein (multidrug efflux system)
MEQRVPSEARTEAGDTASPRASASPPSNKSDTAATTKSRLLKAGIVFSLLAIAVAGYYLWSRHSTRYPSTNDAYVHANVVHLASQVSGTVSAVHIRSFEPVKQGDVLIEIDPKSFRAAVRNAQAELDLARQDVATLTQSVAEAKANLQSAQARFADAQAEWLRVTDLVKKGDLPPAKGDAQEAVVKEAKASITAAESQVAKANAALGAPGDDNASVIAAQAKLTLAKIDLAHTKIAAPADGFVGEVSIRPGSLASQGLELMQMIDTSHWWVDANFKETDLVRIRDGQQVDVSIDILPATTFHGHVEGISPASGAAFSLFPPQNATGNWVKVTQRFPIRIALDPAPAIDGLRVGASASATVDTVGSSS